MPYSCVCIQINGVQNISRDLYILVHACRFQVGDQLPEITLFEGAPDGAVNLKDVFKGKKGVLFAVPGAFTPGCSKVI